MRLHLDCPRWRTRCPRTSPLLAVGMCTRLWGTCARVAGVEVGVDSGGSLLEAHLSVPRASFVRCMDVCWTSGSRSPLSTGSSGSLTGTSPCRCGVTASASKCLHLGLAIGTVHVLCEAWTHHMLAQLIVSITGAPVVPS